MDGRIEWKYLGGAMLKAPLVKIKVKEDRIIHIIWIEAIHRSLKHQEILLFILTQD